jgi:hypothetical protein
LRQNLQPGENNSGYLVIPFFIKLINAGSSGKSIKPAALLGPERRNNLYHVSLSDLNQT